MKRLWILPLMLLLTSACMWWEAIPDYGVDAPPPPVAEVEIAEAPPLSAGSRLDQAYAFLDAVEVRDFDRLGQLACPALLSQFDTSAPPILFDDVLCFLENEQVTCSLTTSGQRYEYIFGWENDLICSMELLASDIVEVEIAEVAPCHFSDLACYEPYLMRSQSYGPFDLPTIGSGTSAIAVRVFMDFMCPHCANFDDDLERLIVDYADEVRFEYFPMAFVRQPQSTDAAKVALCTKQQGLFWQYQAALYTALRDGQASTADASLDWLIDFGIMRGADSAELAGCMVSTDFDYMLNGSQQVANQLGINATPTVAITTDGGETWTTYRAAYEEVAPILDAALGR